MFLFFSFSNLIAIALMYVPLKDNTNKNILSEEENVHASVPWMM